MQAGALLSVWAVAPHVGFGAVCHAPGEGKPFGVDEVLKGERLGIELPQDSIFN